MYKLYQEAPLPSGVVFKCIDSLIITKGRDFFQQLGSVYQKLQQLREFRRITNRAENYSNRKYTNREL